MLTPDEITSMRAGGKKLVAVLAAMKAEVKPGANVKTLEEIAVNETKRLGGVPSFKGYQGYPAAACISVNEEIVHCIPRDRVLNEGDIVSVDMGIYYQGVHVDAAITWAVGQVSPEVERLMEGTYAALLAGTQAVKPGNHVNDISQAIEHVLKSRGLTIFKQFVGHGVGRNLHENPMIPNFAASLPGQKLEAGMALAIEPIVGLGDETVLNHENGWDTSAQDGQPAAHFEHTLLITDTGYEVITPLETLIGS